MAIKTEQPDETFVDAVELQDIEQLRLLRHTPLAVCHGAMEQQGWKLGKHVSVSEYDEAIEAFLRGKAGN